MIIDYWRNSEGEYINGDGGEVLSEGNRVQRDQCVFSSFLGSRADPDQDGCTAADNGDSDGDGSPDATDACPNGETGWTSDSTTDSDNDGCQDSSEDMDDDNDGTADSLDAFPTYSCFSVDSDGDGYPDSQLEDCISSVSLALDNCPGAANPSQLNSDEEKEEEHNLLLEGDACDSILAVDNMAVETRETASPIDVNKNYDRALSNNYDRDWFRVYLEAGTSYVITVQKFSQLKEEYPFDPMVRLFYQEREDSFIADNNGASSSQMFGDARIIYTPSRAGLHWIEVASAAVNRKKPSFYSGSYVLSVKDGAPGAFQSHASHLPSSLSQNADNYELVWEEDYRIMTEMDERVWGYEDGRSTKSSQYTVNTTTEANTAETSTARQLVKDYWEDQLSSRFPTLSNSVLRASRAQAFFRPDDGLLTNSSLFLKISIPKYSSYPDRFSIVSDSMGQSAWVVSNELGEFKVPDGLLPAIAVYDADSDTLDIENGKPEIKKPKYIFGAAPGYWVTYLSTSRKFETRYGYFEIQVNFRSIIENRPFGGKGNFWLKRGGGGTDVVASLEELAATRAYRGYEIDIAENRYVSSNTLYSHFRIHGPSEPFSMRHFRDHDKTLSKNKNTWHTIGMEWTPGKICMYYERQLFDCVCGVSVSDCPERYWKLRKRQQYPRRLSFCSASVSLVSCF